MAVNYLSLRSSGATSVAVQNLAYSTLTGSTLTAQSAGYSTLIGSSMTAGSISNVSTAGISSLNVLGMGYSTLTGSTLYANLGTVSTLSGSTFVTGSIGVSTLTGSTLYSNSGTVSTLLGSTLVTGSVGVSTLTGSTLTGVRLTTSTISIQSTMIALGPNTQSTFVNPSQGSYAAGSWSNTTTSLTLSNIRELSVSSTGQYQLVVQEATSSLYLSSDSGQTWTAIGSVNGLPTGTPSYKSGAISSDGRVIVLAIDGDYLYRSVDSGVTFSAVNTSSPQIHLPLDGNTTDVAGGSSPQVTGSVSYVLGPVTGQAVSLVNTAGSSPATNYIRLSYSPGTRFTASFWFNIQSLPSSGNVSNIFGMGTTSDGMYNFNLSSAGVLGLTTYATGGISTSYTLLPILLNTWYHFYTVYQQNGVSSIYLNGSLVLSFTGSTLYTSINTITIGCTPHAGALQAFNGYIDDVRLINSAVTDFPLVKGPWSKVALSGSGSYLLAGNIFGQVFSSSNGGSTWLFQSSAQAAGSISDLELSATGQHQAIVSQKVVTPNQSGLAASTWTQNGVNWIVSASSELSGSFIARYAFTNSGSDGWASSSVYNTTTGGYEGGISTTVQGGIGSVSGEWLQLQSSVPIVMQSYLFQNGAPQQLPKIYYIVGSNNGTTWFPIHYCSMITNPCTQTGAKYSSNVLINYTGTQTVQSNQTGSGSTTAYSTSTTSYLYFRIIIQSNWGSYPQTVLGEFYPTFLADNTFQPQQTGLTTSTWQTCGVTWRSSASSNFAGSNFAYSAFSNSPSADTWGSAQTYDVGNGSYSGSVSTTVQILGSTLGEWLQLQSSVPLVLHTYSFASWGVNTLPKSYHIVGSNDGSTWYPLHSMTLTTNPFTNTFTRAKTNLLINYSGIQTIQGDQTGSGTTTAYSTSTTPYFYFRVIVLSLFSSNTGVAELSELYLNFIGGQNYTTNYGSTWTPAVSYGDAFNVTKNTVVVSGGASGFVQLPLFQPLTTGVTFSAWFVLNEEPVQYSRIFDLGDNFRNPSPPNSLHVFFNTNRTITMGVTVNSITTAFTSSTACVVGTLYHFVWTITGTNQHVVYINGVQEITLTQSIAIVTYPYFYLGRSNWPDGQSAISILDFRMFNRGLNAAEVGSLYANQNYGIPSLPLLSVSENGKYAICAKDQNLYIDTNYLSGFGASSYMNPILSGINATISDVAVSHTGQYMVLVTAGTTNNVYYSVDYGSTFTSLTIGSSAMVSCAISYDGSWLMVANATQTYTLNRNSTGFSISLGSQAGRVSQATNAIAIGNQAATWNQSANSIVLNASGSALQTSGSGLYVSPIASSESSASASLSLLGYGTDSQIVQSGVTVLPTSGHVGIGTNNPTALLTLTKSVANTTILNIIGAISEPHNYSLSLNQVVRNMIGGYPAFDYNFDRNQWAEYFGTQLCLRSNGNVGIRTNNPTRPLTVYTPTSTYGISQTDGTIEVATFVGGSSGGGWIGTVSNHSFSIYTNDSPPRLTVAVGGNVGIGSTTPAYTLDVSGTIRATGNIISNGTALPITNGSVWAQNGTIISYSAGPVGIGTAAPGFQLHGYGNGDGGVQMYFENASSGSNAFALLGVRNNIPSQMVMFLNSNTRTADGGPNVGTLRNDQGDLRLQGGLPASDAVGIRVQTTTQNVGIGTTNPVCPFQIYGSGTELIHITNPTTFSRIVLNGATGTGGDLIFKDGGTSRYGIACISSKLQFLLNDSVLTIPVTLDTTGFVGIGTTNPTDGPLCVYNNNADYVTQKIIQTTNSNWGLWMLVGASAGSNANFITFTGADGNQRGSITSTGNNTISYGTGSDIRFKENVEDVVNARQLMDLLRPRRFRMKGSNMQMYGFIAQEVQEAFPELVVVGDTADKYLYLDYSKFSPIAVAGVKQLYQENDALKSRVAELEQTLSTLVSWAKTQGLSI